MQSPSDETRYIGGVSSWKRREDELSIDVAGKRRERLSQTAIGVTLACLILGVALLAHIAAIFVIDWSSAPFIAPVVMVVVQSWLFTGMFIVAHDCMHGSLAPGRPWLNRLFGRIALRLYAAFSYDRLLPEHHKHHRRPGTDDDPDFDPDHPDAFWPWFACFMRHYYGWREFGAMTLALAVYIVVLWPSPFKLLAFYALPAALSALQLFYFGTFRPHRVDARSFTDEHNSRTDDFPWFVSLLTCFHFGYHHEHHLSPSVPWWRLPEANAARRRAERDDAGGGAGDPSAT